MVRTLTDSPFVLHICPECGRTELDRLQPAIAGNTRLHKGRHEVIKMIAVPVTGEFNNEQLRALDRACK